MNVDRPIALPAGAVPGEWETDRQLTYRILRGAPRGIASRPDVSVTASAIQLDDGRVDSGAAIEPPRVFLEAGSDGLTVTQALRLASTLVEAVEELERWRANPNRTATLA